MPTSSCSRLRTSCATRSEEHTSELQSPCNLVCRLLLEKNNRHARLADAARRGGRALLAVQAGGEDLGHRGLAGAARADEQVGVVDLALLDRVGERADDVLLTDDVGEFFWKVAAAPRRCALPRPRTLHT